MSTDLTSLYPFLGDEPVDLAPVVEEATRSAIAKIDEATELRCACLAKYADVLTSCATAMASAFRKGATLLAFGNGGSATDADAVADAFAQPDQPVRALPAVSLAADPAIVTALANDVDIDVVFARQVGAYGRPGDIALGLSTSGNSRNVLAAFAAARERGMVTVGFAGYDGGDMARAETIDYLFTVPSSSVHRIQEAQTTLYLTLWELTVQALEDGASRR